MAFGVCPLKAWLTTHSRPRGVKRAFLCTFIRFLSLEAEVSQPHLPRPEPDGQPIESSHLGRVGERAGASVGIRDEHRGVRLPPGAQALAEPRRSARLRA